MRGNWIEDSVLFDVGMNASMVGYWLQGKEIGESFPG